MEHKHIIRRVMEDPAACNVVELMAGVIGGPKANEIAQTISVNFGGDIRRIYNADISDLRKVKGVTELIATRIKASLNLGLRLSSYSEERAHIGSPADAAAIFMPTLGLFEEERLYVMMLDRRQRHMGTVEVYKGSVCSTQVRIGEIFKIPIARMASMILIAHNHPSGDPTPSPDDVAMTRAVIQAGKLLDIEMQDHIIIGGVRWVSLKDRGLGFA